MHARGSCLCLHNVDLNNAEKMLDTVSDRHRQLVHAEAVQIVAYQKALGERVPRAKGNYAKAVQLIEAFAHHVLLSVI